MPLARRSPLATATGVNVAPPDIVLEDGVQFLAGQAVAVVDNAGTLEYRLCGASLYANSFYGFMQQPVSGGASLIKVGRGAVITPIVENSVAMTPEGDVFLSATPGQVTQTPVDVLNAGNIRLGYAVTATQFLLLLDFVWTMGD